MIDGFMEEARGDKSIGTTKKGIGPAYATKAFRTGLRVSNATALFSGRLSIKCQVGQLREWDSFEETLRTTVKGLEVQCCSLLVVLMSSERVTGLVRV